MRNVCIVIPARMASTRFPNKPLAPILGEPMIKRVWRIAKSVEGADEVIIATDDPLLKDFAEGFGASVVMTSPDCLTGTDRVAEIARLMPQCELFFNLQGDAVLTPPWVIGEVLKGILDDPEVEIATPAVLLEGQAKIDFISSKRGGSTSGTCVVFDRKGNALYFSKGLIPLSRDGTGPIYRHIGLYAYKRETLLRFTQLKESPLEKAEKLEPLRALENGISIRVVPVDYRGRTHGSVDRPEDVLFVESIIQREGELLSLGGGAKL
jgi:3-deoxy-manno-octulosonate cytidylyltransferase (CMP-KDO synthetase)